MHRCIKLVVQCCNVLFVCNELFNVACHCLIGNVHRVGLIGY